MEAGSIFGAVLSILGFIYGIIALLLSYLFSLLGFLVSPLLYIAHCLLSVALWPLQILIKFEAFLLFITGAVISGITVGICLYFTGNALTQLLRLYPSPQPPPSEEFDLVPPKEEEEEEEPYDWESKIKDERFMSSTILEEEETSQVSE